MGACSLCDNPRSRVGVDLERIRFDLSCEQLAEQFFSQQEIAALSACSLNQRRSAFFSCWTRKEAYVKAKGLGLSMPLDDFSVSLRSGGPRGCSLTPEPGYIEAVAVEEQAWHLLLWQWPIN
jgi:4'-phosphopantetheinyl transferase